MKVLSHHFHDKRSKSPWYFPFKPRLNDLTLLYNICQICFFNNVEKPAKRFNICEMLAEMFDQK